ncbi:MAG: acylphosphatase [Treponema sp.]|nr:acylphosphatase [Treponema sp.]
MKSEKKRFNYRFTGQVQAVGFRYTAINAARLTGVTGWVHNSSDGSVIMEAQGTIDQIEKQLELIERNPYIQIDEVIKKEIPLDDYERSFSVRY